jgi:hypothetical protein
MPLGLAAIVMTWPAVAVDFAAELELELDAVVVAGAAVLELDVALDVALGLDDDELLEPQAASAITTAGTAMARVTLLSIVYVLLIPAVSDSMLHRSGPLPPAGTVP